jgi:hypothetical protein
MDVKRKVWLDFIPYAKRLFSGGRNDIWQNPDTFISVYSQGQGLLRSDILSIPVGEVYLSLLERKSGLVEEWAGKRPTFALKKLLALDEPREFLTEVLAGLQNLYRGAQPIALTLPSPQKWLQWLHTEVRPGQEISINSDDVEAAAMYVAEYVRAFSTSGLAAVVLEEPVDPVIHLQEAITLYQPIVNLANHYQWSVGISLNGTMVECSEGDDEVDFYLLANSDPATISGYWEKGLNSGGGLNKAFWSGEQNVPKPSYNGFAYGIIPEEAEPEMVLSQLKKLRA